MNSEQRVEGGEKDAAEKSTRNKPSKEESPGSGAMELRGSSWSQGGVATGPERPGGATRILSRWSQGGAATVQSQSR